MSRRKPPGFAPASRSRKRSTKKPVGGTFIPPFTLQPPHQEHRGEPVLVGRYTVLAGGTRDLTDEDLRKADVIVPLAGNAPFALGRAYKVIGAPMRDFGGVPTGWRGFLEEIIVPELESGHRLLVFCVGSHGRTGTFLASLIALLESKEETPDPIAAVRARHCNKAVETLAQAEAIFAIRGELLPKIYENEFQFKFGGGFSLAL